jgi:hypothetical protein
MMDTLTMGFVTLTSASRALWIEAQPWLHGLRGALICDKFTMGRAFHGAAL